MFVNAWAHNSDWSPSNVMITTYRPLQEFVLLLALLVHLVGTSADPPRGSLALRLVWFEIGNNDVTKCGVEAQARG